MSTAAALRSTSELRRPRALKTASREIFRKSRASQGRSAAYRFGASRENAYAYEKSRQDRQSLQTDPVGYQDDFNLYAYVRNDPLNGRDPRGTDTVTLGPELEITPIVGFSVGYGLAVSFPTPWDPDAEWDLGAFGYISGRVGLHGAAGIGSYSPGGSVSDLGGFSGELSGTRGLFTGNVTFPIRRGGEGEPALVFERPGTGGSAGADMRVRGQSGDVPMPGRVRTQGSVGVGASAGLRAAGTVSIRSVERALGGGARVRENRDGSVTVARPREGSRIQDRTTCRRGDNGQATCN